MKDSLETKLGIFFAIALVATLILLEYLGSFSFFKSTYHINARFKNVQELKVGDPIKMAGVRVGRVEDIRLTNTTVEVRMTLDKDAQVHTDSKAVIRFTGLMGQNYVDVDFGSPAAPKAEDNCSIQSVEQPDLSALMARLDNVASGVEKLTSSFSGEKIDNLLGPFTDFLKANKENLTAAIGNIKLVSDRIEQGKGTVGLLINDPSLYHTALTTVSNFQDTSVDVKVAAAEARTLLTNINHTVTMVNSGQGTVGRLVRDARLYDDATDSMTNLKEILQKVNRGQGSVGKIINDESMIKNVKMTLQKVDKATESLEDTGPLSVLGTMAGSLF